MTQNENEINNLLISDKNANANENENNAITKGEKLLLLIAFIVAVLCDRLIFNFFIKFDIIYFTAIFEIYFIVIFYIINFSKIYKKPYLWVTAGLLVSLCIWNFIFDYQSNYGILTFIVIPASLMMFAQFATNDLDLKNIAGIITSWFLG